LNYLPDEASIFRAVDAIADALLPGGLLAVDLCDLEWAARRQGAPNDGRVAEDWAIVTRYEIPAPDRFVRLITAFTRADDGTWQRDDERHENVLVDTASVPARFAARGVEAEVRPAFGQEHLPAGLRAIVGRKR
jgi:hypothetical protein